MTENNLAPRLYTEDEAGSTVVLQMRQHRLYGARFKTMFETAAMELARLDRPPAYYRALFYLLAALDPVQKRRLPASELAAGAQMSQSSAERALAMLEADRVIFCSGTTAAKVRRLNNTVCWAATSEKWNRATRDLAVEDARGR